MITWKRINLKNYTFPLVDEYKKAYINLDEEASQGYLSSIYMGDAYRKMDMSYSMIHRDRRSIRHIEARGVLMDNFRRSLEAIWTLEGEQGTLKLTQYPAFYAKKTMLKENMLPI